MKSVAIIPAGGAGRRLNAGIAKQYLQLDQLPVLVHTLKVFEQAAVINEIILVVPESDIEFVRKELIIKNDLKKVTKIIAGGSERQDSVRNGLAAIDNQFDIVLVHDGVRPFVTSEMISRIVEVASDCRAVAIGMPAKDTIKQTQEDALVVQTMPRQNLWLVQTPQAFTFAVLQEAYKAAYRDSYYGTDDASLVERIGVRVKIIAGSYENIKITTQEDLIIAEALLKNKIGGEMPVRTGLGYDSHRFAEERKLVLGGIVIPHDKGLQGHSDADALIHAVCDAILGAAGMGDIGRHFPDTDPVYKGISSMILLERVREMITTKGFAVKNIDVSIIMEKPKLAPFAADIAANLAKALDISVDRINIKAKTNEGMGFVGRNEGVAVFAVATVSERKNNG
ncbi:MAG: bifunctional 2-C-methyl-D-erythritol 4-phosphate cytidylyltransferase/2-C-methyl-D-erythritol 2,4-cyclodiphosphate synthase [Deltaproteobacteria bacterium HGW-Deltaproteobacteria-10]|nr:MAG: bifunctional 2-C-methyl-D-erythritol 4-phosphate cytidylyltransferase/2-C-methyl-D-erythritol 2,4-cyclodiphosphate synthase [Deltaproteobacteria bacterium HGW-Deltaproteobacteria-10]